MSHAKDTLYTEVYSIQHQATGTAGGPGFMSVMAAMTGFVGSAGDIGQLKEAECRLVVVGRSGSGKSSVVNALLGSDLCAVSHYAQSMTTEAKMFTRARFDKEIMVVDTPGLFDSRPEMTIERVQHSLAMTCLLLAPGPHAILLTVALGQRFTDEEKLVVQKVKDFFGDSVMQYTIVVFTKGDELDRKGVKIADYIQNAPNELKTLLRDVGYRYVVFSNTIPTMAGSDAGARQVLNLVEKLVRHAETPYYHRSQLLQLAEKEMRMLDRAAEQQFPYHPAEKGSTPSDYSDSGLCVEIQSTVSSDTDASQTSHQEAAEVAQKCKSASFASSIRLFTRNQVSKGRQPKVLQHLVASPAMLGVLLPSPSSARNGTDTTRKDEGLV